MKIFGIGVAIVLKEITTEKVAQWAFINFFVPFGIPKMIVVDPYGNFYGMFKNTFLETLLIPVHAVARGNQKGVINEGFHYYFKKVHKIKSADKGRLNQWSQGVFFAMYACNECPVYRTEIS